MRAYSLTHVGDQNLLQNLSNLVAKDRATTAAFLAHIAEVDARKLYAPAGYSSMYEYCVRELRLCEQAAYRRIQVARAARRFPAMFPALADGRLHLTAAILLAPHLDRGNADALIAAASHKTRSEIELLLAQHFPGPDAPQMLRALPVTDTRASAELAPVRVGTAAPTSQLSPGIVGTPERPKVKPLSPERFALQVTLKKATHDKLQYAQELLGHRIPNGDLAQVLDRALDALIAQQEKQKFAATTRPRKAVQRSHNRRTIPAHVKRAVWERDGGQCTFKSPSGVCCKARKSLEFDHIEPVARGGQATAGNIRLRCRAHNQYEAESAFGAGFMHDKRDESRRRITRAQATEADRDVMAALRGLGYRANESRRAVAYSAARAEATLEERVRLALSWFRPRVLSRADPGRIARVAR